MPIGIATILTVLARSTCTLLTAIALCTLLLACSDGSDDNPSPTQTLLAQFGAGAILFSEQGLQALLETADTSSPVVLLQLMRVDDADGFDRYEQQIAEVWTGHSAREVFASQVFAQFIGEREMVEVRAIEFANTPMLVDALGSAAFAAAADTLFAATSDHAWVVGTPAELPFEPSGPFRDLSLIGLDAQQALARLVSTGGDSAGFETDPQIIIDMLVSDSPEPFFMINLIDFYEQANYPDGRVTELTGQEANDIYGAAIGPQLFARNSGPEILFPVSAVLTQEERQWEQAVVVRYASRDAFLNIFALNPNADDALIHKEAGVEKTLVYASEPRYRTPPQPVSGIMFNLRYCEYLLPRPGADGLTVEVWGTQGLNLCPQAQWDALDPAAIAQEFGTPFAFPNGPRYFTVDWSSNGDALATGEPELFGGIEMRLLTTVMPPGDSLNSGSAAYEVARVDRENVWHFVAGRRVYELINSEGTRYIMQSYSNAIDAELELAGLETLGTRLQLPQGWRFESRVLVNSLNVPTIDGVAEVLQDELSNTYQRVP